MVFHQDQLNAVQRAETIYRQTGNTSFSFDAGKIIREGYTKGGEDLVQTSNVTAVFRNDQPFTLYPRLGPLK